MRLLPRYVLYELLIVFLFTLTGMTTMMLLVGVAQEVMRQGLGLGPVLKILPYLLPNALRFAVPGTILFSACLVYGRLAASGEIGAIKALGISPMVVIKPGLILAFVLSVVAVWLNDVAVTWGHRGVRRVVIGSIEEIAYSMLRTSRTYSTDKFSISVKKVRGRKLIRPMLSMHSSDGRPPTTVTAREAELSCDTETNLLRVVLTDGRIEFGDMGVLDFADDFKQDIALPDPMREGDRISPSHCSLQQIPVERRKQQEHIRTVEQSHATEATFQLLTGDFVSLSGARWDSNRSHVKEARHRLHRLQTEPWRRWANGFSCFFFVMVGIPLAIRLKNSDFLTSFFLCFLPILLVYYPLMAFGVDRAKCGALPPYVVWLGNIIAFFAGLLLLRRVLRY